MRRGVALAAAAVLISSLAPAAAATAPAAEGRRGTSIPAVNLAHLDWLRREVPVPGGRAVSTWQIYAAPVRPGDRQGPYRFVGDEDEGIGCVDDVARAAIVYARAHARTGDAHAGAQARAAFDFVRELAKGDGTYYNFIWADGRINQDGPTSRAGLTWWTARALWALGEGARAFRRGAPGYADELREQAFQTVDLLLADVKRRDGSTHAYGTHRAPGWFLGDAPDATAVAVLGLAALETDRPDPRTKHLIARYGEAIAAWAPAAPGTALAGAHLPGLGPQVWHAYGAHMLHALAAGGKAIASARLIGAARQEADRFVPHLLVTGGPIAGFLPAPSLFPQIAYGVEPQVLGLLALEEATGERRYGKLAGLFASWLTGENPARRPMYDARTGRVWDGVDPRGASLDAGAESTIEGLLTLQALAGRPDLAPYVHARETARRGVAFWEAEAAPGALIAKAPGLSGEAAATLRPGAALRLTGWLAPDVYRLTPVAWRDRHVAGERASLTLRAGDRLQTLPVLMPPAGAPWNAAEALETPAFLRLGARADLEVRYAAAARQDLRLDGVIVQPEVEYRVFRTPAGLAGVVVNHAAGARQARIPGFARPVSLPPYGAAFVEAPTAPANKTP